MGVPGWDKVDKLAQALVGLRIQTSQARNIVALYKCLDKRPLHHLPRQQETGPGDRFGQSKGGHITIDILKKLVYYIG